MAKAKKTASKSVWHTRVDVHAGIAIIVIMSVLLLILK